MSHAAAGDSVREGVKGVKVATEDIRKGINDLFDKTVQPNAARDREAGVTAHHKPATTATTSSNVVDGPYTGVGSTHSAGSTGSGFSADAKRIGKNLLNAVHGDKTT